MDMLNRKPAGFWTKDAHVKAMMIEYVEGTADLETTAKAMQAYCIELNVHQPLVAIQADVVWYARGVRKALGLASVREAKQIEKAKQELAV
jgi:hypothetical protein